MCQQTIQVPYPSSAPADNFADPRGNDAFWSDAAGIASSASPLTTVATGNYGRSTGSASRSDAEQVGRVVVLVMSGVLVLLQVCHVALIRPMINSAFANAEELPEAFERQRTPSDHPINTVFDVATWLTGCVLLAFLCLGHKWARIAITVWLSLGIALIGCCGTGGVVIAVAMGVEGLVAPAILTAIKYAAYFASIVVLWKSEYVKAFLG